MSVHILGLAERALDYSTVWELQRSLHREIAAGDRPDTLLLLEHESVFTAGSRTQPADRPLPSNTTPVIDVDRGGRITWHGPGQLVGYPLMTLPQRLDVVAYVRALEAWLIDTCAAFNVTGTRVSGRSGVWTTGHDHPAKVGQPKKVAAIGVRVAKGVTQHGFALNCDCALSWADEIVACGLPDAGVTSLSQEASRPISTLDAIGALLQSGVHESSGVAVHHSKARDSASRSHPATESPSKGIL